MLISYHKDPVLIDAICDDLQNYDAVFFATTTSNFDRVERLVNDKLSGVVGLCAKGGANGFDSFLYSLRNHDGSMNVIEERVKVAITIWEAAGGPVPHVAAF